MPVSQTEESSAEIPRLFLVRLPREGGYNYLVCRGEVLFDDTNLPESVEGAVLEAFAQAAEGNPLEVIPLPNPDDESWGGPTSAMQVGGP